MGRKPKFIANQKLEAVEDVLIRHQSLSSVSRRLGFDTDTRPVNYWISQYRACGIDGLKTSQRNRKYTEEDKMGACALVEHGLSIGEVSRKLLIPKSVISGWLKCYTNPIKGGLLMGNRGGKCIYNGPMEGFWGILKSESYYGKKIKTFDEMRMVIDTYKVFYNMKRRQESLSHKTPYEYRLSGPVLLPSLF